MDDVINVGARLKAVRQQLKMSQAAVSQATGIPLGTYKKYEGEERLPGSVALAAIGKVGVNINWLLSGEGPMLLSDLDKAGPTLDVRVMGMAIKELEEALGRTRRTLDPERKARAVGILYEFHKAGPQDRASVERLLDLVA
jgi:transcriptional regulator with XRE-family HTH domain